MRYIKPSLLYYRIAQMISWIVAFFVFGRKVLRNEIKGKKGPYVVIANHQCALDFVNLIGLSSKPLSFVISNSFYSSLPIKGFLDKMGVIPKQQFQTAVGDLRKMKSVIDNDGALVIYPAGLMCEDGISTPIPSATYRFLKWLDADIYAARTSGSYFVMPKWSAGIRTGRTFIDVYKLISREELASMDEDTIREKAAAALEFDAYRDQEEQPVKYSHGDNIEGLENVLYLCPNCGTEHKMKVRENNVIYCENCGYTQESDEYAFMHNVGGVGKEIRYVSDWSKFIYDDLKKKVQRGYETGITVKTRISMIDLKRNKFSDVGSGVLALTRDHFELNAKIKQRRYNITIPLAGIPTLPFKPGKYLELQHGENIYRCVFDDGRLVMKCINLVKVFYELSRECGGFSC